MMTQPAIGPAIIVDPYSSGAFFAGAFERLGVPVVAVMSAEAPPDVYAPSFRPQDFERVFVARDDNLSDLVTSLRALGPSCVLTGCESGVELTDRIASKVLPERSNRPEMAQARRHKGEMARALVAAGVPSMRQICTGSVDEVAGWIEREGLTDQDLVIKPPKSASTDGVVKVPAGSDWRATFSQLLGSVNRLGFTNDKLVVQEYLRGVEYAVDTASFAGRHSVASVCRYNKTDNGPFMAIYDTMEWMAPDFADADVLKEYAVKVLDAVGMRYGTSHIEIMLTKDGPRLVEIGFSKLDFELKTNLRVVFLLCRVGGQVSNRAVLDKIATLPSHHFSKIHIRQGDWLKPTQDLFASLDMGFVVLAHQDAEQIAVDTKMIREFEAQLYQ